MFIAVIFLAIIAIFIIFFSIVMSPDSNAFSGAIIGSGDLELFRSSRELGFRKFTKWAMFVLGFTLLFVSALLLRYV